MTVSEIYARYTIMPSLQLHQLRVAAVADCVAAAAPGGIDREMVLKAALFHDMGNILKSDFRVFPEFCEPEGIAYWESIKAEFLARYGSDEHEAALAIGREIGLSKAELHIIGSIRFSRISLLLDQDISELHIVQYADLRVAPSGIVSMEERLVEGHARYRQQKGYDTPKGQAYYELGAHASRALEQKIFASLSLKPEDITEQSLELTRERLREREFVELL